MTLVVPLDAAISEIEKLGAEIERLTRRAEQAEMELAALAISHRDLGKRLASVGHQQKTPSNG